MRIIHKDPKQGEVKVVVETLDDLWYLSQVIEAGDKVAGRTERKVQATEAAAERRPVFLAITVERVEFAETQSVLRVAGKIVGGPEDIPRGSYHTFAVEPGTQITITKQWSAYHLQRLEEAAKAKPAPVLVAVFDREDAVFALLTGHGYKIVGKLHGDVVKKRVEQKQAKSFWSQIIAQLEEYVQRYSLERVILASPSFWKEELLKELANDVLKKKLILATCSSADEAGVNEVLKRDETKTALQQHRASQESKLVEEVLTAIAKEGAVSYGLKEVEDAASQGAVQTLLVTDGRIMKERQAETFKRLEAVMAAVDKAKGSINIISSTNDAGKKLDGLGGVAALLRWKS